MSRIVRSSKFRHVFGQPAKKENCYDDLKTSRTAWDSNYITANPLYFAVLWEAAGGGSFAVIPWDQGKPKVDPKMPIINGHKSPVLDIDFNPFNDNLIASVSEDCTGKIWGIPDGGLKETLVEPLQVLSGHRRKVGSVLFNPVANNIVATSSTDLSVKVWDIQKGTAICSVDAQHTDLIQAVDWNSTGSLLATSCKDKHLRILDPRQNTVVSDTEGHQGVKGSRTIWLGNTQKLFSVGFTKTSEREYALWDPREMTKPIARQSIDSASGVIMPFFDRDTNVLFLAGKGDGNIRYYEIVDEAPYIHYLTEFKSNTPQRGMAMLPKRAVNVSECEIVRLLKLGPKLMEPISMQVPRKSEVFQDDIFPPCFSGEFSLTTEQWVAGQSAEQKTASLEGGFVQRDKPSFNPERVEDAKPLSERELREEVDRLTNRVAYLEAELVKRDARLKELSG